jgi:hypothetical protein
MGVPAKLSDFILFLTLKSQKLIAPSLPQVINQMGLTGENETEFTGKRITLFGFYSSLCDLNVIIDF